MDKRVGGSEVGEGGGVSENEGEEETEEVTVTIMRRRAPPATADEASDA